MNQSITALWNHDAVKVILSGVSTMEQVIENIQIAKSAEVNSMTVNKVKTILEEKVIVGCTTCGYCMPCPEGVNIPQNFTSLNDFFRFDTPSTKFNTKMMYASLLSDEEKSSACIECGKCEEHCPQGIPIREKLKEVSEVLKM